MPSAKTPPPSAKTKAVRLLYWAETNLALIGGVIVLLLVLLSAANALGRWLFSAPIDGYIDWAEQSMAFMAFLGLAYVQRRGEHIRMDIFIGRLRGRRRWALEGLAVALMLAVVLPLVYGSFSHFLRAYQIGDSSLDIQLPTWPSKLAVPVALSFLAAQLFLQLISYARAVLHNRPPALEAEAEREAEAKN